MLGCSGIRTVSSFSSAILADLAMRGFAISFLTLARVALPVFCPVFLCSMHPDDTGIVAAQSHFERLRKFVLKFP